MRKENQVFHLDYGSNKNFNQMANSGTNKEVNVSNVISNSSFVEKEIEINGENTKCLFFYQHCSTSLKPLLLKLFI